MPKFTAKFVNIIKVVEKFFQSQGGPITMSHVNKENMVFFKE